MRSLLAFCFGLLAVFYFVNVCEGTTSNDDAQEVDGETLAYITNTELESEAIEEIESELEEAIEDMINESEGNTAVDKASKPDLPVMFPSMTRTSKSQRKMNKEMSVKIASIIEEAVLLVANDILQTAVLLQTDPEDFLQINSTSTSE